MKLWAHKAKFGAFLTAFLMWYISNPDSPIVQYITIKYPHFAAFLGMLAALLLGGGLLKTDKNVKRDIKLKEDPLFGERKIIEPTRVDTTVVQVKPFTKDAIVQEVKKEEF